VLFLSGRLKVGASTSPNALAAGVCSRAIRCEVDEGLGKRRRVTALSLKFSICIHEFTF